MALSALALFLILLPILEFVGSLIYVYLKDPLVFAVDFRIAGFTFPALVFYQFCTWFFVRGLICPTQVDTSFVPIIIFGINAFIYTVYIFMYWYNFEWFQSQKTVLGDHLKKLWPAATPAPTTAPATSSPAPATPATPASPASPASTPKSGSS